MRMTSDGRTSATNVATATALAIAIALPVRAAVADYGWLDLPFGTYALLFWFAVLIWGACVVATLLWRQRWWILLTAPVVLYPVGIAGLLIAACMRGDCL